jgi:hypothetical protein
MVRNGLKLMRLDKNNPAPGIKMGEVYVGIKDGTLLAILRDDIDRGS